MAHTAQGRQNQGRAAPRARRPAGLEGKGAGRRRFSGPPPSAIRATPRLHRSRQPIVRPMRLIGLPPLPHRAAGRPSLRQDPAQDGLFGGLWRSVRDGDVILSRDVLSIVFLAARFCICHAVAGFAPHITHALASMRRRRPSSRAAPRAAPAPLALPACMCRRQAASPRRMHASLALSPCARTAPARGRLRTHTGFKHPRPAARCRTAWRTSPPAWATAPSPVLVPQLALKPPANHNEQRAEKRNRRGANHIVWQIASAEREKGRQCSL